MTYLAPRQGLFAIIVLVSFCLQTLLLVISTDHQLNKSRVQKGEQMVAQLIDEARLSLENQDRVSLSVIANRYTSEQDVARLVIKDNKNNILVPVGNAPLQQGDTIRQIATNGDAVIGSVALTLKEVSFGEIITMQWPFVISSLILHLFLWLLYGYVARPTKEQINTLSRDIQDLYRDQYHHTQTRAGVASDVDENARADMSPYGDADSPASLDDTATTPRKSVSTAAIHNELNAYLKAQQTQNKAAADGADSDSQHESAEPIGANQGDDVSLGDETAVSTTTSTKLSDTRSFDHIRVQFMFHDEYNMLERLAPEIRTPYLALCSQLLQQAVTELLKLPLLLGVSAINEPRFDEQGAYVELRADNSYAKVALAGVMLGKLYLMLNKIIYAKHIELSRFALSAKVGVSDEAQSEAMRQLINNEKRKDQLLILLPAAGRKQIASRVQMLSLKRPTTVYERECAVFEGGNDEMIQRLAAVRNAVLMSGNEDAQV